MRLEQVGPIIEWRGPAPFYFLVLDADNGDAVQHVANALTYGWGVVPAAVTIGDTTFSTSLIPRTDTFFVPLKKMVREREGLTLGDIISAVIDLA